MREIKFRQPITSLKGKFLEFHYWGFISKGTFASPETTKAGGFIEGALQNSQQFTGLLDKNGKEIYEGDIILISPFGVDKGCMYTIVYIELVGRYDGINMLSGIGEHLSVLSVNCKIIGNAYENPELLEIKK